jgi:hypothetical protein
MLGDALRQLGAYLQAHAQGADPQRSATEVMHQTAIDPRLFALETTS